MGAAAQFHRERSTDLDDADLVTVVLAEQRHGPHGLGLGQIGLEGVDRVVGFDRLVRDLLDLGALSLREARTGVEVEPEVARAVQRTGLCGGGAEHLPQRCVHQVGAGMSLGGAVTPRRVDGGEDFVAFDDLALVDHHLVQPHLLADLLDVLDAQSHAVAGGDGALVGHLPTGLGIQRTAVRTSSSSAPGAAERLVHHRLPDRGREPRTPVP